MSLNDSKDESEGGDRFLLRLEAGKRELARFFVRQIPARAKSQLEQGPPLSSPPPLPTYTGVPARQSSHVEFEEPGMNPSSPKRGGASLLPASVAELQR